MTSMNKNQNVKQFIMKIIYNGFSEHINVLASTTTCTCNRNKQDKLYSKNKFTLHITDQINNHYEEFLFEDYK